MEHLEEVGTRDKTQAVVPKESIKEVSEGSILERRQEGQSLDHCAGDTVTPSAGGTGFATQHRQPEGSYCQAAWSSCLTVFFCFLFNKLH